MANGPQDVAENGQQPQVPFWQVPLKFAYHAVVGSLIFSIIALFAIGLNLAVRTLEHYNISRVIIFGLELAESLLFITDLILFFVFLWRTAKRTLKHL